LDIGITTTIPVFLVGVEVGDGEGEAAGISLESAAARIRGRIMAWGDFFKGCQRIKYSQRQDFNQLFEELVDVRQATSR
jgi:hypothetical protein